MRTIDGVRGLTTIDPDNVLPKGMYLLRVRGETAGSQTLGYMKR
jgi:hypothetical protein